MERQLAVVTAEHAYLRSGAGETDGSNQTGIEDEIFSGWAVEILEEDPEKAFVKVLTHYGYEGYVRKTELRPMTKEELKERQEKSRFTGSAFPRRIFWTGRRFRACRWSCS